MAPYSGGSGGIFEFDAQPFNLPAVVSEDGVTLVVSEDGVTLVTSEQE